MHISKVVRIYSVTGLATLPVFILISQSMPWLWIGAAAWWSLLGKMSRGR